MSVLIKKNHLLRNLEILRVGESLRITMHHVYCNVQMQKNKILQEKLFTL